MGTAALCASVRFLRIQRAVGAIKTRQLSCFSWILVSYEFLIKIFNISLVYWRNTALSSLAIHKVWRRSAALSCTNIPALLIQSFYQELVSGFRMRSAVLPIQRPAGIRRGAFRAKGTARRAVPLSFSFPANRFALRAVSPGPRPPIPRR